MPKTQLSNHGEKKVKVTNAQIDEWYLDTAVHFNVPTAEDISMYITREDGKWDFDNFFISNSSGYDMDFIEDMIKNFQKFIVPWADSMVNRKLRLTIGYCYFSRRVLFMIDGWEQNYEAYAGLASQINSRLETEYEI